MNTRESEIRVLLESQRRYFRGGATRPLESRRDALDRLDRAMRAHEDALTEAVRQDLGKNAFETYTTEIGLVYKEIRHARRHLRRWMRPRRVRTDLHNLPGWSRMYPDPYGVTLIIAPWNYPVQLLLSPLVGALAGGNTVVVKPSEMAPATALAIQAMLEEAFEKHALAVVQGDSGIASLLLEERWDKIFFTGSVPVGRIVMEKAARHLTPITLELGGKSPVIVDGTANLEYAARKIAWGKYLNAGQTCVAPDYLLVEDPRRADRLVQLLREALREFYGPAPLESTRYSRIVNERHFERLTTLLDADAGDEAAGRLLGGERDRTSCRIAPTILYPARPEDRLMEDEIFGPILPVIPVETLDQAFEAVLEKPKPLAAYLFSESRTNRKRFLAEVPCGGGGINTVVLQVASVHLPFGGVGPSGTGSYHGRASFDAFTHWKGILFQTGRLEVPIAYPGKTPALSLIRRILG
ncbi:MAG: aldehyde dehydrogenase family protein [Spirochaetaceae bacterium]|nr:MAG: aldehyde dehydrogenase family protein [Spirochaetaceae bacterium]